MFFVVLLSMFKSSQGKRLQGRVFLSESMKGNLWHVKVEDNLILRLTEPFGFVDGDVQGFHFLLKEGMVSSPNRT